MYHTRLRSSRAEGVPMTEQQVAEQIAGAHSPEQVLSPSRANTPPPNQQTYSRWATPPPAVPNFSLFARATTSESREPSQPAVDPALRPLPLQYQPAGDPRTPPRRSLPRTPEREPAPELSDSEDNPFDPTNPMTWTAADDPVGSSRAGRGPPDQEPPDTPEPHGPPGGGGPPDQGPPGGPPGGHPGGPPGGPPPPPPPGPPPPAPPPGPPGAPRHHHLRTLRQVLRWLVPSLSHQHQRIRKNPTSKRRKTSLKQRSGTASADRLSSTSRRTNEISTMTKRSFDSC